MSNDDRKAPPPAKATLFCPDCGHEGHAIHGWDEWVDSNSGVVHLECPVCDERVQTRGLDALPIPAASDEPASNACLHTAD